MENQSKNKAQVAVEELDIELNMCRGQISKIISNIQNEDDREYMLQLQFDILIKAKEKREHILYGIKHTQDEYERRFQELLFEKGKLTSSQVIAVQEVLKASLLEEIKKDRWFQIPYSNNDQEIVKQIASQKIEKLLAKEDYNDSDRNT